jgi:hypothetical protein
VLTSYLASQYNRVHVTVLRRPSVRSRVLCQSRCGTRPLAEAKVPLLSPLPKVCPTCQPRDALEQCVKDRVHMHHTSGFYGMCMYPPNRPRPIDWKWSQALNLPPCAPSRALNRFPRRDRKLPPATGTEAGVDIRYTWKWAGCLRRMHVERSDHFLGHQYERGPPSGRPLRGRSDSAPDCFGRQVQRPRDATPVTEQRLARLTSSR